MRDNRHNMAVKDTNDTLYNDHFFDMQEQVSLRSSQIIVPIVLDLVNPTSVIDFGCGRGTWLRTFQENGVRVIKGLDGYYVNQRRLLIDPACFESVDLSRPFAIDGQYDLAVCLEVAEHLPLKISRPLIATLTSAAPLVLFSAAIPGQGGIGHVNEQWPSYWRALFAERGFQRLDPIRRHVWQDNRVASYYQQNIFLYASKKMIARSAALQAEQELANDMQVECILVDILNQYTTVAGLLRELQRATWRAIRLRLYWYWYIYRFRRHT